MNVAAHLVLLWLVVALGLFTIWSGVVRIDPSEMPGGGPTAMLIVVLAWPLILIVAVLAGIGAVIDP